jgi:hypothetical protein
LVAYRPIHELSQKLVKLEIACPLNPRNSLGLSKRKPQKLHGSTEQKTTRRPGKLTAQSTTGQRKDQILARRVPLGATHAAAYVKQLGQANYCGQIREEKFEFKTPPRGVTRKRLQPQESSRSIHNRKSMGNLPRAEIYGDFIW